MSRARASLSITLLLTRAVYLSRTTTSVIANSTEIDPKVIQSGGTSFPSLTTFISVVCEQSNVQVSTLLATLVYLERLRTRLPRVSKGEYESVVASVASFKHHVDPSPC